MSDQLFVIKNIDGIIALYIDLKKAKKELKNIYNNTIDYKHYCYEIDIYNLINGEYVNTNASFIYVNGVFQLKI